MTKEHVDSEYLSFFPVRDHALLSYLFDKMALCRLDWVVLMLGFLNVAFSMSEDCYKMDVCSCRFKNGSIVSLWPVDGGSKGPR